ncbi:MAG: hypothetical protein ACOXZM_09720 [Eubacteriales bacterium]
MANFHAVRLCAVGTESQMQSMLANMLINVGYKDNEIPASIEKKLLKIKKHVKMEATLSNPWIGGAQGYAANPEVTAKPDNA